MFGSGALSYQQGVVVGDRAVFVPTVGSRKRHGYARNGITYRISRFMELPRNVYRFWPDNEDGIVMPFHAVEDPSVLYSVLNSSGFRNLLQVCGCIRIVTSRT